MTRRVATRSSEPAVAECRIHATHHHAGGTRCRAPVVTPHCAPSPERARRVACAPMSSAGPTPVSVLVVDDEESMRHFLQRGLKRLGYEVETAADGEAAVAMLQRRTFSAMALDLRMPGLDGLAVLARSKSLAPGTVVVLMTAHGSVSHAVEAMKLGAADFLQKPFELDELSLRLSRALAVREVLADNAELQRQNEHGSGEDGGQKAHGESGWRAMVARSRAPRTPRRNVRRRGAFGCGCGARRGRVRGRGPSSACRRSSHRGEDSRR